MNLTLVIVAVCGAFAVVLLVAYLTYGRGQSRFTLDIGGAAPRAQGGSSESKETHTEVRLRGLMAFVGGVFAVLLGRLAQMQLVDSDSYSQLAERNRRRTVSLAAPRGRILDRNGVELVTNRSSLAVVAEPDVVGDEVEMALLANVVGMPYLAVRRRVQDQTVGAQNKRLVAADVSRRVVAYLGVHPDAFPGVEVEERTARSYPHGSLAAHVVGYTGTVTSEQLEASEDAGEGEVSYQSGDVVGQSGIEAQYESVLQGVRGEQTVFVDASGSILDYSTTIAPTSGSDVEITIDSAVQAKAEDSLVRVVELMNESGYDAQGASVVALDCTNGEVIAMASYPTYNPSIFVGGISNADWEELQSEDAHYPMMNRAISGQYPSGSTIKALSALAGLDYGIIGLDDWWHCTGYWQGWKGFGMHCWSVHGDVNLVTGITNSCDVVFYEIGKGFFNADENQEGMQETYRKYGLGSLTGIDLPGEVAGRVPDAEWKWNYWSSSPDDARRWQGGDNCNLAIGQGDLAITSLQLACAYMGIANEGDIWRPHLLRSVRAATGEGTVIEYSPEVILTPEEPAANMERVKQGLRGVVYDENPQQAAHWTNLSVTCEGKTGTAEQSGGRDPMGWFVAYAPAESPRYVVACNVDGAIQGASSAMYVVRDVFGAIYDEPDTSSVLVLTGDR